MTPMFKRRAFLKASAAVFCGLGPTFGLPALASARVARTLRVAVLLPNDAVFATAFAAGLRAGFTQYAPPAEVAITLERAAKTFAGQLAQMRMLMGQGHDTLVVFDPRLAGAAATPADGSTVRVIVSDAGERMPGASAPNASASLHLWQAHAAAGRWLAHTHKRAAVVMSMHEAGYDGPFAFESGFVARGGEVVARVVVDPPAVPNGREFDIDVVGRVRAAQPDVVYALLRGTDAALFVQRYARAGWPFVLAGAPLLMDAVRSGQLPLPSAATVVGVLPWPIDQSPIQALGQTTAQRVLGGRTQTAPLVAAAARAGHIHTLADLGDVSNVVAPVLHGLRSGWSMPYWG